jgi:phytanoyl-CoA hydroxylase
VFKDGAILYESSVVYKPKGKHNEVPFHQDFMNRGGSRKLIVWVALDKVTVANGALKVVPGSHKDGYREFVKINGETHHTRLKGWESFNDYSKFVEMNKGDVLIFDARLIHGSERVDVTSTRFAARFAVSSMAEDNVPRCVPVILSSDINLFSSKAKIGTIKETLLRRVKRRIRMYVTNNYPV